MTPRTTVVSVPYALRSGGVTTVSATPGPGTCTATTTGAMHFNTALGAVQVCNGTDWTAVGGGTPTSCAAVLAATPSATSGTYTIDPDGPSGVGPVSAYCDMGTEGGGWSLCLSVQTTSTNGTDDFPNGQYWRDATFSDTPSGSWTPWDGGPVLPNLGDASGSYGCARHGAEPQEILFEGVYTDGTRKAIRAPLPSNWNTTGEWSSAATRVGRLGTWSNAGTDFVCFTQASLLSSTAATCADRYTPNNGGTTFVLGAIGSTFENAAGNCATTDRIGTCGLFLADNQTTWVGENDEIGDHGTYGGWGWGAGSGAPPQRVNVYVR